MATVAKIRKEKITPFGLHDKLHVDGKYLVDKKGKRVDLRGISTHNMSSYPKYINEACITELTDRFGLSVFRFAMYSGFADGDHGYADGDFNHRVELEDLMMKGVEVCAKLGIYCLVDWHILLEHSPMVYKEEAKLFFKSICKKLRDYDNVIYEICNEPNGEDVTWDVVKEYANEIIPVIREIDPEKIIVVGTPTWSQDVDLAAKSPLEFENVMYTLHFYADTHKESLREKAEEAIAAGLPIFCTEYGVCNAAGDGDINKEESERWIQFMKKNHVSFVQWNLSNKEETSAMIRPSCTKFYGFEWEDFTPSGQYMKELFSC